MDDPISRQAAIKLLEEWADGYPYLEVPVSSIEHKLNELPTAEKKGRWIEKPNIYGVAYCSECDYELHTNDTNYCPNCGARMVKE